MFPDEFRSLKNDYIEAIEGISKRLVKTTPNRKLVFVGELKAGSHVFMPKMVSVGDVHVRKHTNTRC